MSHFPRICNTRRRFGCDPPPHNLHFLVPHLPPNQTRADAKVIITMRIAQDGIELIEGDEGSVGSGASMDINA